MIGRTLGHYRIDSTLGKGGMGVVYKGHDVRLNRTVAVKVLPLEHLLDPSSKQRFLREAQTASALNHPGIVTVFDIGSVDGSDFIVMECIEGQTLDAVIPPTGMPPEQTARYGAQIADALAAAHGAGVLHRDLKPSNVMVTPVGRVKILDFGVAKLLEKGDVSSADTMAAPLTEARTLIGTAAYMSPEQADGRPLDVRSDIFSFGIVLYQMATGRQPFAGESRATVLGKIVNDEPKAPRDIKQSVSAELEKIILRCLRKDPARRFQSMADLKVAIEDVEHEAASPMRSRQPVPPWRWALLLLASAALAAAAVVWQLTRTPPPPAAPMRAETLTTLPGAELYPSFSPDGNNVTFTWTGPAQDNADIYVQQIGAGSPLRLTTDAQTDANPVWSPDGRWIAFLRGETGVPLTTSNRELRLIPPLGGPERKLTDIRVQGVSVSTTYLTWCPDSSCVVVSDSTGAGKPDALFIVPLDTGVKRQLTTPASPILADTSPVFAPDGRTLLFLRRSSWAFGDLMVAPWDDRAQALQPARRIDTKQLKPDYVTWSPDGRDVIFSAGAIEGGANLWRIGTHSGAAASMLPFVGDDAVMLAVAQARGGSARLAYVRSSRDENVWKIETPGIGLPTTVPLRVAISSTKADTHPQLSPDGSRVAFTSTRSGTWEIWVSNLDGSNAARITSLHAPTGTGVPHWSPDSRQLVFASDTEGQFDIFIVPSEGGKATNLTSHAAFDHVPIFSRDGKSIYFSSTRSGDYQVWKMPASGGEPVQVTRDGGWVSQESVDARDLYYTPPPNRGGVTALWRLPLAGGAPGHVLDGVINGSFAVLENGIYSANQRAAQANLEFYDFATRRTATIAQNLGDGSTLGGLAASADGRVILYAKLDSAIDDLMLVENFR